MITIKTFKLYKIPLNAEIFVHEENTLVGTIGITDSLFSFKSIPISLGSGEWSSERLYKLSELMDFLNERGEMYVKELGL